MNLLKSSGYPKRGQVKRSKIKNYPRWVC